MLYLEDEEIDDDDLRSAVKTAAMSGSLAPVLPMSAVGGVGFGRAVATDRRRVARPVRGSANRRRHCRQWGQAGAFVFKTTADEFVGRLSFLRVVSGSITSDAHLDNAQTGNDERLAGLSRATGKTLNSVPELTLGDIGVVTKLPAHHDIQLRCGKRAQIC